MIDPVITLIIPSLPLPAFPASKNHKLLIIHTSSTAMPIYTVVASNSSSNRCASVTFSLFHSSTKSPPKVVTGARVCSHRLESMQATTAETEEAALWVAPVDTPEDLGVSVNRGTPM